MKKLITLTICMMLILAVFMAVTPQTARADSAVVGTGTPASCTEAVFDAALAEIYPGATAPGGVLTFNCGPNPHTIIFTGGKHLSDGTIIDGGGLITLSGGNSTQIFFVTQQARVELHHIRLVNGYAADGGAIFVEANTSGDYTYLLLNDVTLSENTSTTFGGAISAQHTALSVINSRLIQNSSNGGGGAISLNMGVLTMSETEVLSNTTQLAGSTGGGLNVWNATLDIRSSKFQGNKAMLSAGGAISLRNCTGSIASSQITQNTAYDFGGGIYHAIGDVTFSQVMIMLNTAPNGGGITNDNSILLLDDTTLTDNTANNGGGIYNFNGQVTLLNAWLLNNQAVYGGGVYNQNGTLALMDVTVNGNSGTSGGGGLYNSGQADLNRVTMTQNTSGDGGAIFNTDTATVTLTNATLSANLANFGGGVFNLGTLSLINVTVAHNTALGGGGGLLHNNSAAAHLAMVNTLFALNTAIAANSDQCLLYEPSETQLFSLWSGGSCGTSTADGNQPNTNAPLDPLGFTGTGLLTEKTMTHALLPGSPAEDAGTCGNGAPAVDQRGIARPYGSACDIGAVETTLIIQNIYLPLVIRP
jgi:predicted outer membrane repeat protein